MHERGDFIAIKFIYTALKMLTTRIPVTNEDNKGGRHSHAGGNLKANCIKIPNQVGNDDLINTFYP